MSDEIKWRLWYFWRVVKLYARDDPAYRILKQLPGHKRVLTWRLEWDSKTENHEGTFWQFLKWLITHERVF